MEKRNNIKKKIHEIWKNKLNKLLEDDLEKYAKNKVLIIGFNIFPKDYRVKINIPNLNKIGKLIFNLKPEIYASNQIKYYINVYANRIIKGVFPLNLLNLHYLANKYDKFTNFYAHHGYVYVEHNKLLDLIVKLENRVSEKENLADKTVYVATLYKSGDIIPINSKKPLEGFLTKEEAINQIRHTNNPNNMPIYVYKIKADQFDLNNGKIIASNAIHPFEEESILLTTLD